MTLLPPEHIVIGKALAEVGFVDEVFTVTVTVAHVVFVLHGAGSSYLP